MTIDSCHAESTSKGQARMEKGKAPRVGMRFKSFEETCEFCKEHGRHLSFGIKIRRSYYNEDKKLGPFVLS